MSLPCCQPCCMHVCLCDVWFWLPVMTIITRIYCNRRQVQEVLGCLFTSHTSSNNKDNIRCTSLPMVIEASCLFH